MKNFFFLLFYLFFLPTAFAQQHEPKDINAAADSLVAKWKKYPAVYNDKSMSGPNFLFTEGMDIRNLWIHGNRDTVLVNQFLRLGISNSHDMSSIIISLGFMKLKHQNEDLDSLINKTLAQEQDIKAMGQRLDSVLKEHLKDFKSLKKGDSVRLYLDLDSDRFTGSVRLCEIAFTYLPKCYYKPILIVDGIIENVELNDSVPYKSYLSLMVKRINKSGITGHEEIWGKHILEPHLITAGHMEYFFLTRCDIEKY